MNTAPNIDGFYRKVSHRDPNLSKLDILRSSRSSATYGELTQTGARNLIRHLDPKPQDVFLDIGSGVGKLVLQAAMSVGMRQCVGIERVRARHEYAVAALEYARQNTCLKTDNVVFEFGNALDCDLSRATKVFMCSTCFSPSFLTRVARKLAKCVAPVTVVTLREFELEHRGLEKAGTFYLSTTWTRSTIAHVYRSSPA